MFSLLNDILVWFMSKKSHVVYWVFAFVGPGNLFHALTLQKHFKHMKVKNLATAIFKKQLSLTVSVILSSKGTSQLEVPNVRTLGNIHGNFLNKILFYCFTNKCPIILFLEIYKSFETTSKMLFLENGLCIYSWYGSRRLVYLVFMYFCALYESKS